MDLDSTLIRAEALFRRFQRLVETIDKKHNFPAPRALQSPQPAKMRPEGSGSAEQAGAAPEGEQQQGAAAAKKGKETAKKADKEEETLRMITPELRALLSRKVEVLPRAVVKGEQR